MTRYARWLPGISARSAWRRRTPQFDPKASADLRNVGPDDIRAGNGGSSEAETVAAQWFQARLFQVEVTSERAVVLCATDKTLEVRFADGRDDVLSGDELAKDRLDYAYAVTVHRMQGATVDSAHVLADGGGRELAYVAMSRARESTQVYVVADDTDQAVDDLTKEWGTERRQRWLLDTDAPADIDSPPRPNLARRTDSAIRLARLRAEHDAVEAVAPDADARLAALRAQLRLEQVVPAPSRGIGLGRVFG